MILITTTRQVLEGSTYHFKLRKDFLSLNIPGVVICRSAKQQVELLYRTAGRYRDWKSIKSKAKARRERASAICIDLYFMFLLQLQLDSALSEEVLYFVLISCPLQNSSFLRYIMHAINTN